MSTGSESSMAVSKPPMLALLTNGGSSSTPSWTVSDAGYQANEELIDVLSCQKVTADGNGGVSVQGSSGSPQVLMPTSALNKSGSICAEDATGGQASAAQGWIERAAESLPIAAALLLAGWAAQSSLVIL